MLVCAVVNYFHNFLYLEFRFKSRLFCYNNAVVSHASKIHHANLVRRLEQTTDSLSIKNAFSLYSFSHSHLQEQNYTVRIIEYRILKELAEMKLQ